MGYLENDNRHLPNTSTTYKKEQAMLSFPTPPTDNLYKFAAISGLLIAAVGLALPTYLEKERIELVTRLNNEAIQRNRDMFFRVTERHTKDRSLEPDKKAWEAHIAAERISLDDSAGKEMKRLEETTKHVNRVYDGYKNLSDVALVAGPLIALIGSTFWYLKVQRLSDRLLLAQVAEGEAKASQPPTTTAS